MVKEMKYRILKDQKVRDMLKIGPKWGNKHVTKKSKKEKQCYGRKLIIKLESRKTLESLLHDTF